MHSVQRYSNCCAKKKARRLEKKSSGKEKEKKGKGLPIFFVILLLFFQYMLVFFFKTYEPLLQVIDHLFNFLEALLDVSGEGSELVIDGAPHRADTVSEERDGRDVLER